MQRGIPNAALFVLVLGLAGTAEATPVFFSAVPYLSVADVPVGFYAGGSPTALEDFEDSALSFGITTNRSWITAGGASVDADDGSINGVGGGKSLQYQYSSFATTDITFSFASPVTAAGLVVTVASSGNFHLDVFGPGMVLLGSGPVTTMGMGGSVSDDTFFGVTDLSGITAIRLDFDAPFAPGNIWLDHVQFGSAVPEPGTGLLVGLGLVGIASLRRRA